MRNKAIVSQARQKLILTALDRKEAGLSVHSKKPLAATKNSTSTPRTITPRARKAAKPQNSIFTRSVPAPVPARTSSNEPAELPSKLKEAGTITHYLDKIDVAIIKLTTPLKNGDQIYIQGTGYLFLQNVAEMQIDRKNVAKAKTGSHIGMKTNEKALVNGKIYKL